MIAPDIDIEPGSYFGPVWYVKVKDNKVVEIFSV